MIYEDLEKTTRALKDLEKKIELKNNSELQELTDSKYKDFVEEISESIYKIQYIYDEGKVEKSADLIKMLLDLLDSSEKTIERGLANKEKVKEIINNKKNLDSILSKEWTKQYNNLTRSTISTLEVIKGIQPESVDNCIQKIAEASDWKVDVKKFKRMFEGLDEAKQLITSLSLDDEIVVFLQKTNSGKATLFDLNDKVLKWIRKEKLEKKIRVYFLKGN